MNRGSYHGVHAPAIIRPTYYPWRFGCAGDADANGNGTDDTEGLQRFLNGSAGSIADFGGRNYVFNGRIYVRSNTFLNGYGSGLVASPFAPANCSSLCFTDDTQGTAAGPGGVTAQGLTISGNATLRRANGKFSGVGGAGNFYAYSCAHLTWRDLISLDSEGDAYSLGGDDSLGGRSIYFRFDNLYGTGASRNGISFFGALRGSYDGCIMTSLSFGAAHSNISVGYDHEPDGANSQNEAITSEGCQAIACATEGWGFHNNVAYNANTNIVSPYTESCAIGYASGAAGVGARIIGARYKNNTTNFSNISESLASFP